MDPFALRAPWFYAGPLIGLAVVLHLWLTNRLTGATGGFVDLLAWAKKPKSIPKFTVFLLLGMALGGVLASYLSGTLGVPTSDVFYELRYGSGSGRFVLLLVAGALIGFGARTAGGCTSGHGVCGNALGSPASLATTVSFLGAAIATSWVVDYLMSAP